MEQGFLKPLHVQSLAEQLANQNDKLTQDDIIGSRAPTITDFNKAQHDHSSAAQGGLLGTETVDRTMLATVTRKVLLDTQRTTITGTGAIFPNGSSNILISMFIVPDDYVSGDLTYKCFIRGDTSGNVIMSRNVYRFRQNTAYSQIDTAVQTTVTMATGSQLYSFTTSSTAFTTGDLIRYDITRLGADAGDTAASDEDCDGVWIEYTGRA